MKKLVITRHLENDSRKALHTGFRRCKTAFVVLESGEILKRGCGGLGVVRFEAGWKCLYCGNYSYGCSLTLETLWTHFKIAREYWRAMTLNGREYINGMPVAGYAESLPRFLLADLLELQPPYWFRFYVSYGEGEFADYLITLKERHAK